VVPAVPVQRGLDALVRKACAMERNDAERAGRAARRIARKALQGAPLRAKARHGNEAMRGRIAALSDVTCYVTCYGAHRHTPTLANTAPARPRAPSPTPSDVPFAP